MFVCNIWISSITSTLHGTGTHGAVIILGYVIFCLVLSREYSIYFHLIHTLYCIVMYWMSQVGHPIFLHLYILLPQGRGVWCREGGSIIINEYLTCHAMCK